MTELVTVRVRDCACPDSPHEEGDYVYLRPVLGIEGGMAAELDLEAVQKFPPDRRGQALFARWFATFLRYGAVGWNLTDERKNGKVVPRPFDVEELIDDYDFGRLAAEKANDLYAEAVMRPLLEKQAAREKEETEETEAIPTPEPISALPPGPTNGTTSQTGASTRRRRKSSSQPASVGQQSVTSP